MNLFAALRASGNALDVFQQALSTTQNNINNANTAGYAKQTLNLTAMPIDITGGLIGGVTSTGLVDSRDQYAEETVQQQTAQLGYYTAQADATSTLQNYFDVTGTSGVASSLQDLFTSFSAWSESPSDATARQSVLTAAQTAAASINGLMNNMTQTAGALDTKISSTVTAINTIAGQIQQYNVQRQQEATSDPGTEAQLYASLSSLSQYTGFSTLTQSDGTVTVMLPGGDALVSGTQVNELKAQTSVLNSSTATYPNSTPTDQIVDSNGQDLTSQLTSGQLGGLLDVRNRIMASVIGDGTQQGSLNELAQGLADSVNTILQSGKVSTDASAASGTSLFSYDTTNLTNVAGSLSLDSTITAAGLAGVDSSGNVNGNAQTLAGLASVTTGLGTINGANLTSYFGNIASGIGSENSTASDNETTQQQVVAQATSLRDAASGVSLNEEAVNVMTFQKAYQAAAQVLTVLNNLTDTLMTMLQ